MKFTRAVQNCKQEVAGFKHRLIRRGRRVFAILLSTSLVLGGFPSAFFQVFAASDDSEADYNYSIEGQDFYDALIAAVSDGTTVDRELQFYGEYAEDYDELFDPDGTLYELENFAGDYIKEKDEDAERDRNMTLRVFARIEGDIPFDEAYEPDGSEEVIFLMVNRTKEELSTTITVDDRMTESVVIPDYDSIPTGDEQVESSGVAVSAFSGGAGGSSGNAEIVIDTSVGEDTADDSITEDSKVEIDRGSRPSGTGRGGRRDPAGDEEKSAEKEPDGRKGSDGKKAPKGKGDAGDKEDSKNKENSKDREESSLSRSENKSSLLHAGVASESDAKADSASPSVASPSDAEMIEGIVYEPVRFGKCGAVAFVTTTEELGIDSISLKNYILTYEGGDYRITIEFTQKADLPDDVIMTGEEYDKDSDTFKVRYEEAEEFYGWTTDKTDKVRLFYVGILSDGEEIEPSGEVEITFTFFDDGYGIETFSEVNDNGETEEDTGDKEDTETDTESDSKALRFRVTHFGADVTEDVESEIEVEEEGESVSFTLKSLSDIMVMPMAYDLPDEVSGKAVLNLGNGNGIRNFADYTGNRSAGTLLRYTFPENENDTLAPYADDDGNVTINLPSDNDLNSDYTVVDATGSENAITIELGKELAYDYKLIGWVNIATGEYYDVSEHATTASINLENENVFYADWIAASYDHGSSSDENLRDDVVSTSGFVTIHLYDYNDILNMYSASLEQNGITSETWTDSGKMYDALLGSYENINSSEISNSFVFVNDGTGHSNGTGLLQVMADRNNGNTWTGSGRAPRNATTCWGVTTPDDPPFKLLFDPESSLHGVTYVGEGDYLLWIDEDGYYRYDSREAAATYNQSDERFYVYDDVQDVNGTDFSCFLPYNDYKEDGNDAYSALYGSVDYWFGMDLTVSFYLSNATGRGGNKVNDADMVFNFSGDDDIMIFIDGELLLDMSGIHDESFGSINFTDGTITMGMALDDDGNITDTERVKKSITDFSLPAGNHQLQVYYMERGGYASNLEIEFNIMPLWEYESGPVQTVTAEKVWQTVDGSAVTDMSDMPSVEVGLFDVVTAETDPGYTQNGDTYTLDYTDDKGVFHEYIYTLSSSGDTLVYTEGDTTVTYSNTNSDGKIIDDDGLVIAWLDDEKLHIRIDEQTLSNDNDWKYAWELLDSDGNYEAIELSESSTYTSSSESADITTYQYWSIIGESEIESHIGEDYPVILTEAAQEAESSIGNTKEAYGWVIVGTENGVETEQVKFSQIATMEERTNAAADNKTYHGIYGVTSQSEIEALGSGAVWYMEDAGKQAGDVDGETLEEFYLYCILNGDKYYLVLDQYSNGLATTTGFKATFYYDALGELMVDVTDDTGNSSTVRVEILEDGSLNLDQAEEAAAVDDIRIYTLTETETSGFAFTAKNTIKDREFFDIDEEIVPEEANRSTWEKSESVNEYDSIELEMSTYLPRMDAEDIADGDFTLLFHNVLDDGLKLDADEESDLHITIGGKTVPSEFYTVDIYTDEVWSIIAPLAVVSKEDGCTFHVTVDLSELYISDYNKEYGILTENDFNGETEIIVYFYVDLEGTSMDGTYTSTVYYEVFDAEESIHTSNTSVVYVYTYEIEISKSSSSTGSPLAGATFGLYYDEACTQEVIWYGEHYTVTSDEDGKVSFYGLAAGTYYLKELEAPEGYVLSDEVFKITLGNDDDNPENHKDNYSYYFTVSNTPEGTTGGGGGGGRSGGGGGGGSGSGGSSSGGGSGSGGPGDSGGSGDGDIWDLLPLPQTGQGWAMLIGASALLISALALTILLWFKRKGSRS